MKLRKRTGAFNSNWKGGLRSLICPQCKKEFKVKPYRLKKKY
jgi:hypothetical protein